MLTHTLPALALALAVAQAAGQGAPQATATVDLDAGWHRVTSAEAVGPPPAWENAPTARLSDSWDAQGLADFRGSVWYVRAVGAEASDGASATSLLLGPLYHGAYEVFADGTSIGGWGLGSDALPFPRDRLFRVPDAALEDGRVVLAIRVDRSPVAATTASRLSPVFRGARLGPAEILSPHLEGRRAAALVDAVPVLLFAVLALAFGLVHLAVFLSRREQRAYLWFGIGASLFALNAIAFSPWTAPLFERLGPPYRLTDASGHVAAAALVLFLWQVLERPLGPWLRAYLGSHVAWAAFVLLAPLSWVVQTGVVRFAWLLPILLVSLWVLVRAALAGSVEARILLGGALVLVAAELAEFARRMDAPLPADLPYLGFMAVLVAMAGTLGVRFSRTHAAVVALRDELEAKVTERTAELERKRRDADDANDAKSRFMSMLTHEMRNPLTSITGFALALRRESGEALSEAGSDALRRIEASGRHLLTLSEDLLDLAHVEAGKVQVKPREVDLAHLVEEVAAEVAGQARDVGAEVRTRIPAGMRPLHTDPVRLRQILLNLVGNALKFAGGGAVDVVVEAVDGRPASLSVTDRGPGIPAHQLGAVFEPFFRGAGADGGRGRGYGLGLSITRSLCQLLGFTVEVRSTVGEGTTFVVRFGA